MQPAVPPNCHGGQKGLIGLYWSSTELFALRIIDAIYIVLLLSYPPVTNHHFVMDYKSSIPKGESLARQVSPWFARGRLQDRSETRRIISLFPKIRPLRSLDLPSLKIDPSQGFVTYHVEHLSLKLLQLDMKAYTALDSLLVLKKSAFSASKHS